MKHYSANEKIKVDRLILNTPMNSIDQLEKFKMNIFLAGDVMIGRLYNSILNFHPK
jgi:hypothetical protein